MSPYRQAPMHEEHRPCEGEVFGCDRYECQLAEEIQMGRDRANIAVLLIFNLVYAVALVLTGS